MAEPVVDIQSPSDGVSTSPPASARAYLRPTVLQQEVSDIDDMHDGPDYVDDWMEKNLPPDLMAFVRDYCTSFVRWDLLRRLYAEPLGASPEGLADAVGASLPSTLSELESLAAAGLVTRRRRKGQVTYHVERGSDRSDTLAKAIRAYDDNREFRFALVYSIVRSSHHGAVLE